MSTYKNAVTREKYIYLLIQEINVFRSVKRKFFNNVFRMAFNVQGTDIYLIIDNNYNYDYLKKHKGIFTDLIKTNEFNYYEVPMFWVLITKDYFGNIKKVKRIAGMDILTYNPPIELMFKFDKFQELINLVK